MVITKSKAERLAAFESIMTHWSAAKNTLGAKEEVKSVGIGYKEVNGNLQEQMVFIAYVTATPANMPANIQGIPVDVRIIKATTPLGKEPKMMGGIRVDADIDNPGTLGCIALRMPDEEPVLLSSHHVLYGKDNGDDDKVFHPDKCCSLCCACNVVARTLDKVKGPYSDAAIARIKFDDKLAEKYILHNRVKGLGAYTKSGNPAVETLSNEDVILNGTAIEKCLDLGRVTIVPAIPGDRVRKVGLATGRTIGIVTAVGAACTVDYEDGDVVVYLDQVSVQSENANTEFAKEQDSGAVIVNDNNSVVGLLMSGQGKTFWANNIHNVMADLKIRIHNPPKAKIRVEKAGDGKTDPLNVTFYDESVAGEVDIVKRIWNLNDGRATTDGAATMKEDATFSHTFKVTDTKINPDTYYVSLTVIDKYGLSDKKVVPIEVVKAGVPLSKSVDTSLFAEPEEAASFALADNGNGNGNGNGHSSLLTKSSIANATHTELLQYVQEQLLLSENGRNITTHISSFQQEVITLVNKNRKVTVTWQRKQGPAFVAKFLKALRQPGAGLPQEVNGIRVQSLLQAMALVLEEEGSDELALAIREHSLMVFNLFDKHRTLEEILSAIHGSTVAPMIR